MVRFLNGLVAIGFLAAGSLAQLKDRINYPSGLGPSFDPGLNERTEDHIAELDPWGRGWIPQGCKDRFISKGYQASDAEVFNVKYDDCDRAWTFCRHKDSQLSIGQMVNKFGRLPIHMRSLVRHPIALPQADCSAEAYTGLGDIVMYGPCTALTVWIHEVGHQLDSRLNPVNRFSASNDWLQALAADSCVPDSYANFNAIEDFAQVAVVSQFNTILGYKPDGQFPGCFDHQHGLLEHNFRANYLEKGGSCDNRPADSPPVSMNPTKRDVMAVIKWDNDTELDDPSVIRCNFSATQ
ncbi:hypothetical protein DRE_00359 [Drechslerella stenobrocha 248]|uniref:Conidiation-specific protein 13 n=1 Tax=Drechslerella stenobrocha 248 TaxID=1043628 RepID=W7HTE4_9PEZI|nr:hypothetical protein DRE_00359 [Drechslerella stenobrocha 248]